MSRNRSTYVQITNTATDSSFFVVVLEEQVDVAPCTSLGEWNDKLLDADAGLLQRAG